jgi:hypothetical protein
LKLIDNIIFTGTYKSGNILNKCDNKFLEQIKEYNLSYCKLSNNCIEIIEKMKNLESLYLLYAPLNIELITILSNSIKKKLFNLKSLSLYHTFLNSKSGEMLINMLSNMKNLINFIISENDIGTEIIIKILKCLSENCHDLNNLDISKTINEHFEGLNNLWDYLSQIYNLNKLKIQDNYINNYDMELFKEKLSDNFIMLNQLDLSYNSDIDGTVLSNFLPELKKYSNQIEVISFWGVGYLNEQELNKFREIFPGRIKLRNKRRR